MEKYTQRVGTFKMFAVDPNSVDYLCGAKINWRWKKKTVRTSWQCSSV